MTMGVTIHYAIKLAGASAYEALRREIADLARLNRWHVETVDVADMELMFTDEDAAKPGSAGGDRTYRGRVRGLVIELEAGCEHLQLLFDDGWRCQDFVKTQFAPIDAHLSVVRLLRTIAAGGADVTVEDEGGFWATSDLAGLERARKEADAALSSARSSGDFYVPFAIGGRIIDMLPRSAIEGSAGVTTKRAAA
jgi:hypothetical protein